MQILGRVLNEDNEEFHKNVCLNERRSEIKIFITLHISSIVRLQNMGKVVSNSTGKVWENRTGQNRTKQNIPRSIVSYIFCEKPKSIQFPKLKNEKVDLHSTGKVWENKSVSNLWIS